MAVNIVIGLDYYLRVAALLFAPRRARRRAARAVGRSSCWRGRHLALTALVTIGLSVYPQPLLHAAGLAAH